MEHYQPTGGQYCAISPLPLSRSAATKVNDLTTPQNDSMIYFCRGKVPFVFLARVVSSTGTLISARFVLGDWMQSQVFRCDSRTRNQTQAATIAAQFRPAYADRAMWFQVGLDFAMYATPGTVLR
eukprot:2391404-Rhodomonas_salina.2